jgi:hypothetical protein
MHTLFLPCPSFLVLGPSGLSSLSSFLLASRGLQCGRGRRSAMSGVRTSLARLEAAALPASVLRLWPFRGVQCSGDTDATSGEPVRLGAAP